jgi:hypothetical protein
LIEEKRFVRVREPGPSAPTAARRPADRAPGRAGGAHRGARSVIDRAAAAAGRRADQRGAAEKRTDLRAGLAAALAAAVDPGVPVERLPDRFEAIRALWRMTSLTLASVDQERPGEPGRIEVSGAVNPRETDAAPATAERANALAQAPPVAAAATAPASAVAMHEVEDAADLEDDERLAAPMAAASAPHPADMEDAESGRESYYSPGGEEEFVPRSPDREHAHSDDEWQPAAAAMGEEADLEASLALEQSEEWRIREADARLKDPKWETHDPHLTTALVFINGKWGSDEYRNVGDEHAEMVLAKTFRGVLDKYSGEVGEPIREIRIDLTYSPCLANKCSNRLAHIKRHYSAVYPLGEDVKWIVSFERPYRTSTESANSVQQSVDVLHAAGFHVINKSAM